MDEGTALIIGLSMWGMAVVLIVYGLYRAAAAIVGWLIRG